METSALAPRVAYRESSIHLDERIQLIPVIRDMESLDLSPSSSISSQDDEPFMPTQEANAPSPYPSVGMQQVCLSTSDAAPSPAVSPSNISVPLATLPAAAQHTSRSSTPARPCDLSVDESSESDQDAEGESGDESEFNDSVDSDYADSDSEYTPVPIRSYKQAKLRQSRVPSATASPSAVRTSRSTRTARFSPYTASSSPSSSSSCSDLDSPRPRAAQLRHTSARKTQISVMHSRTETMQKGPKRWGCMHCDYVQKNHRRPDLKRHIAGHFQSIENVCCGVRLEEAQQYGATDFSKTAEFQGELRTGGCWQVFSRRDALIRHLKNPKKKCVTDIDLDKEKDTKPRRK